MKENNNKIVFWAYLGQGIAVFLLCIGVGSCTAIKDKNPNVPLIVINQNK